MRLALAAAALLIAACSPPPAEAPPAPRAETTVPAAVAPDAAPVAAAPAPPARTNADILSAAPVTGRWFFDGDGADVAAGFGQPNSEYQLVIACNGGADKIVIMREHELTADQDTALRIITATQSVEIPAQSYNEGLPNVRAELDGADPRLDILAPAQRRFAIEIDGEASVFPWDPSIRRTLANCGA